MHNYIARSEAAVEPYDQKVTCVLRQRPPATGSIRIDNIHYPYELEVWHAKPNGGIAVLKLNVPPEALAYGRNPEIAYLTAVLLVGKIPGKKKS